MGFSKALPFIATIIYRFIIGQLEMDLSRLDLDLSGGVCRYFQWHLQDWFTVNKYLQ